ncbi:MAG TPA: hypothetical protein VGO22_24430 [Pseudorhizobium sp.]|jgi:hypothetical protein|nr:hypothetical protein [Pseudorhizobium sp.]
MTKVPTFGFSAFLKVVCSNPRPQKYAVRERHKPAKAGGYDYHRSLRRGIHGLTSGNATFAQVLSDVAAIKKPSERRSAKRGIVRFLRWLNAHPGKVTFCEPIVFESPSGLFRVKFEADCVIEFNGRRTALHIWNTRKPKLSKNHVAALLTLVQRNVDKDSDAVDDFAVLSLQDNQLYCWSEDPKGQSLVADKIMQQIEQLCSLSRSEFGWPPIDKKPPLAPHPDH